MTIHLICPGSCSCGTPIEVEDRFAGNTVGCPMSGERICIPAPLTSDGWEACIDPERMLCLLPQPYSRRKLRLFAVACCYRIWPVLDSQLARQAVAVSERYADGLASEDELGASKAAFTREYEVRRAAVGGTWEGVRTADLFPASGALGQPVPRSPFWPAAAMRSARGVFQSDQLRKQSDLEHSELLRDIFGNPFRPTALDPAWLAWNNGTVSALAQAIYEERAFDCMPILADALEDAGCHDADILAHCRGPGPHARGCWVVDLLLKKT